MEIRISSEDYLEAILILKNKLGYVRNVDIAEYMGYSRPSVTHAITVLRNAGYVRTNNEKHIMLTKEGQALAEKIYERHEFFKKQLISIGVEKEIAIADACKMEHAISDESFKKMKEGVCIDTEKRCFECGEVKCPDVSFGSKSKKL